MKGDFTRSTFNPDKHYNGVRMQQGRVQVDADFNEYVDIQSHLRRTSLSDIIGLCGGPQDNAGFEITVGADGLSATKGRYYVDGILCENKDNVLLSEQPDLPGYTIPLTKGFYLAYLDVWRQHLTTLEDKEIREVALGGPDTATRTKTVWQVKLIHAVKNFLPLPLCSEPIFKDAWDVITKPSSGLLTAVVETSKEDQTKPCIVPARAGYRGLENQLYRVEIHTADAGKETFKWSRENGSVVFPIKFDKFESGKSYVTLSKLAKDKVLALHADDLVEISGDTTELNGKPGTIAKVLPESEIDKGAIVLDGDIRKHKDEANLKVRRWDHKANDKVTLASDNAIPIQEGKSLPLENGVMVKFENSVGNTYHTGDYWMIPARTATRDIEWPREGGSAIAQLPQGNRHHFCRLAVLSYDGTKWERIHDCRRLFPPLTELVSFSYVGGDGQEAMPGKPLLRPLQVSVVNGMMRVSGAKIQFKVIGDSGYVKEYKDEAATPCLGFTSGGANTIEVQTGADGIASACWRLDDDNQSEQVEATLIEIDGKPMTEIVAGKVIPFLPPIRFNANLSVAWEVFYNTNGCIETKHPQAHTVQAALDQLYCNAALYYVGGDGQEALPGDWLPQPLQVRVANGKWPVANAEVIFIIQQPSTGLLKTEEMQDLKVIARTNESGLAVCEWQLDKENSSQQVKAFLAKDEEQRFPIFFNANATSRGVSCCITVGANGEYKRLDEAIIDLRKREQTDICLCLLPGGKPQVLPGKLKDKILSDSELSISISGCGSGSLIYMEGPLQYTGIKSFSITDAVIEFKYVISNDKPGLVFKGCSAVSFNSCHVSGVTDVEAGGALLSIGTTDRVQLRDNTFEATPKKTRNAAFKSASEIAEGDTAGATSEVAATPSNKATLNLAGTGSGIMKFAGVFSRMPSEDRTKLVQSLVAMADGDSRKELSKAEVVNIAKLQRVNQTDESIISTLVSNIRRAAVKASPGIAIILGEGIKDINNLVETGAATGNALTVDDDIAQDETIIVENNEILGIISLYDGLPVLNETKLNELLDKFEKLLMRDTTIKTHREYKAPPTMTGLQGTLEIRGNRIVGITVGQDIIAQIINLAKSGNTNWLLNIFARCMLSENVIEGKSFIVSQHLVLATNDFAMSAVVQPEEGDIPAGGAIADSSVYMGNQGCRPGIEWQDISFAPASERTNNPWMHIA